jgi:voltage-gated potassium channel
MGDKNALTMRRRVFSVLTVASAGDVLSRAFDIFLIGLILLNVTAVIAASVQPFGSQYSELLWHFEIFSIAVFSVEYLLRVWSCVEDSRYSHPVKGRLRYMLTPLAIIDLLAVLPFYLSFTAADLRVLRILRIFRLLRIAKIARYSQTLQIFGRVLIATRTQLFFTLLLMAVLLVLSSSLLYAVERQAQPEVFSSIPAAMWWSIATLTTVGYGDIYPITPLGKFLGSLISIFGIGMFALPTGVLGAAFLEEIRSAKKTVICPHCGKEIGKNGGY